MTIRKRNGSTAQSIDRTKPVALGLAFVLFAGFSVAVAGLAPAATSATQCDVTVSEGDSLQAAVDDADEGDEVCVEAGTFVEDLTVNTASVTLSGPNEGTGDADRQAEATLEGQVVLQADGIIFDGFDVAPPAAEENQEAEALRVSNSPDDVTVANNIIRDFSEAGLPAWIGIEGIAVFGGDANDPVEDVTIAQNKIHGIEGLDAQGGAAGIMVQGHVLGATVEENVITDIGLEATAWAQAVVVTGTGNHGLVPEDVDIRGNDISSIQANPETPWFGVGIGIETAGSGYLLHGNTIQDTELGIEVKQGAGETVAASNYISGTTEWGAINTDDETLDATGNWWGSPLGPSHDDNAFASTGLTGDSVSDGIAFDPWCLTPLCLSV